jgi:D-3-phosphoglycerate dehydrogenase
MATCKVALVGLDGQAVPDWVAEVLADEGIDLVAQECRTDDELARVAADADVVWLFGGSRVLNADNLARLPRCGAVVRTGSGTDNVPVEAATRLGIVVANTPDALTEAVSDHAIGLLFAVLRQIALQGRLVREGVWDRHRGWPLWHLRGRTLGLVGFGRIARLLVRKLSGFDLSVLAYDPLLSPEALAESGARPASLEEVLSGSDVVSVHCPLTPDTRHLIGERALGQMKPTAVLLNTARGPVIDEAALARALAEGRIAGAGLDVLEQEPPDPANPLLRLDNVVVTPHLGGYSDEYLETCWRLSLETVVSLARRRRPPSCVNRPPQARWPLD